MLWTYPAHEPGPSRRLAPLRPRRPSGLLRPALGPSASLQLRLLELPGLPVLHWILGHCLDLTISAQEELTSGISSRRRWGSSSSVGRSSGSSFSCWGLSRSSLCFGASGFALSGSGLSSSVFGGRLIFSRCLEFCQPQFRLHTREFLLLRRLPQLVDSHSQQCWPALAEQLPLGSLFQQQQQHPPPEQLELQLQRQPRPRYRPAAGWPRQKPGRRPGKD